MSYLIEPFSLEWILTNFLSFTLIIFLLLSPRYILKNDLALNRKTLSYFFLVFLICRMLVFHLVALTLGVWDVEHILPFHLCGIASLMCIFILFKYNQSIYEFLLLLGMPGAVWALLTPQINIHEPFYMYIDYFINHAMIIFVPIFLPLVEFFGVNPYFFAMLIALNLQTSFLTPPMAMSAYYLKGVQSRNVELMEIFRGIMPFLAIVILAMVLMYWFPGIALWLPETLFAN